jgi:hypothetical protein
VFIDDYSHIDSSDDTPVAKDATEPFDDLIDSVERHGRVREDVARLVVMTRAGGVSIEELADAHDVDPQTLRQRRLRAECRVQEHLTLAR